MLSARNLTWTLSCWLLVVGSGYSQEDSGTSQDKGSEAAPGLRSLLDEQSTKNLKEKVVPAQAVSAGDDSKVVKPTNTAPASKSAASNSRPAMPSLNTTKQTQEKETTADEPLTLRKVEPKKLTATPGPEDGEKFTLKYKMEPGLVLHGEVTHVAKNGTSIDSVQQDATSRTVTKKTWTVTQVDGGEATFEYRIDNIDMSQQSGNGTEIRYGSDDKEPPPPQFANAADKVGKIQSVITIDAQGMVVARSDLKNPPHMGMGDVTVPLPKEPITAGTTWEIPRELRIQREGGAFRMVKFRELFKLEKVSAGVATISVRSEPLTALTEPAEEAQVLQQLSNGTIRFDVDAGYMLSKELKWNHKVVGFSGTGSVLEYAARLEDTVERAEKDPKLATKAGKNAR